MNRHDRRPTPPGEAQLEYLGGDFRVIRPGTFVRCAVTDQAIPLEELRYWNVERQEAYVSREAVMDRIRQLGHR